MGEIFLTILNRSIAAGWLILAVIALRLLLRKAPKWINCLLWGIVAVRLICPFSLESVLSLIPRAETIPIENIYSQDERIIGNYPSIPVVDSGVPVIDRAVSHAVRETKSISVLRSNIRIFAVFWAAGMILMLAYAIASYLSLWRKMRASICLQDNVYLNDDVKSPFILGVVRPHIYIPSDMEKKYWDAIIAHENAHLRRHDHWWKPLGYVLLTVYWFHPLMWLAYVLLCRDIEFACDEKVVRDMEREAIASYSQALLDCSFQRRRIMVCPLAFGELGVKERIRTLLHYRRPAFWIVAAAVVMCMVVAVCFLTNPVKEGETSTKNNIGQPEEGMFSGEDGQLLQEAVYDPDAQGGSDFVGKPNQEYIDAGLTYQNNAWYYQDKLAAVLWDENGGIYTNDTKTDNVTYIEVLRSQAGTIKEINEVTREKIEQRMGILSFIGTIVERTIEGEKTFILVEPMGDELSYKSVRFELPADLPGANWADRVNSVVAITCKGAFEESQPPIGELISIDRVGSSPIMKAVNEELFSQMPDTFYFMSGVGGWRTELYLQADGSFTGRFEDSEAAWDPVLYPRGTSYICEFSGSFTQPEMINDFVYSVHVQSLSYTEPEVVYYEEGVRYITETPYGLENADEILIYLPGYSVAELSEDAQGWIQSAEEFWGPSSEDPKILPFFVLYNVNEGYAFFSKTLQ